jgi:hypothetical protein
MEEGQTDPLTLTHTCQPKHTRVRYTRVRYVPGLEQEVSQGHSKERTDGKEQRHAALSLTAPFSLPLHSPAKRRGRP